ncbi:MAG: ABC transporter ATP-binding protein [Waddliaceae bacterium]
MKKAGFDYHLIRWLSTYLKPFKLTIVMAVFLLLIAKVIEAFIPYYLGKMVNEVLGVIQGGGFVEIKKQAYLVFSLIIISTLFEITVVWLRNRVGQKSLFHLRRDVYRHIQQLNVGYFDRHSVGSLMTRTIHDVDQLNQMFSESVVPLLGSIILFTAVLFGSFLIDIRGAILLWILAIIVLSLTQYFRLHQRRLFEKIREIVSTMNSFIQEHLMGAATITSFGLQKQVKKQFEEVNQMHCDTYKKAIHYYAFFFASLDFFQGFFLIAMFALLIIESRVSGEFMAGTFFSFSLYALMLFRPLVDLADRYNLLQSAFAAGNRLQSILSEPIEEVEGEELRYIEEIVFDRVYFAYIGEDFVLKDFSLVVNNKESLAVVGLTGSGKTTILNLLLRFYDYNKGSIRINGKEITQYSKKSIRKQVSVIFQDPEIFSGTIQENLTLGDPDISHASLEKVMQELGGKALLRRFPDGIKTALNERGKSLSVGEKQLLALTRAFVHPSTLFFFDEATANIDTETEKIIEKILNALLKDRTSIVIAHRLSTIRNVDRIVVMEDGKVVEEGSHQELLALKGHFEKLYRLQFSYENH